MPKAIFVVDEETRSSVRPAQTSEQGWEEGIFLTRVDGKSVVARRVDFTALKEEIHADHIAFSTRREAMNHKNKKG